MKGFSSSLRLCAFCIVLALPAAMWAQNYPVLSKAFGAPTIPLNGSTSLTFTITVLQESTYSSVAFTDSLPAGLVVATPNGLTGSCGGGTITATAGTGSLSLAGATLDAASCTFSVNVTGTTAGVKNNTTSNLTFMFDGPGQSGPASASVTVIAPPTVVKSFGAASIATGANTSLSFTVTNGNASAALNGVGFTDTLPAGLTVATPNGLAGSCGGGTITATAGAGSLSLAGGAIAASASCTFSVNVTGTSAGIKNNTTTAVTSTEGGTGGTASASVTVVGPPAISKVFGAANIAFGASTSLSFTITNNNAGTALSGVGFTDTLPAGLAVATPNGLAGSCGGGTITATAGTGSLSLAGAALASSASCTFSVNVTGTSAGVKNNTTTAVTSAEGGTGGTASASITVGSANPPTIGKAFGTPSIAVGATTTLSFTVGNPNASSSLSGVIFTDTLPAGITIATPNGLTGRALPPSLS